MRSVETAAVLAALMLAADRSAPAGGQGSPEPASETPAMEQAGAGDLSLDALRDPFWPVGWRPKAVAPSPAPVQAREPVSTGPAVDVPVAPVTREPGGEDWDAAAKALKIKAQGAGFMIVEGAGVLTTGDMLSFVLGGRTYVWKVREITKDTLSLDRIEVKIGQTTGER